MLKKTLKQGMDGYVLSEQCHEGLNGLFSEGNSHLDPQSLE